MATRVAVLGTIWLSAALARSSVTRSRDHDQRDVRAFQVADRLATSTLPGCLTGHRPRCRDSSGGPPTSMAWVVAVATTARCSSVGGPCDSGAALSSAGEHRASTNRARSLPARWSRGSGRLLPTPPDRSPREGRDPRRRRPCDGHDDDCRGALGSQPGARHVSVAIPVAAAASIESIAPRSTRWCVLRSSRTSRR
jgi:hypothetical protein